MASSTKTIKNFSIYMFVIASIEVAFCIYFLAKAAAKNNWQNKYLAAVFLLISDVGLLARYVFSFRGEACTNVT